MRQTAPHITKETNFSHTWQLSSKPSQQGQELQGARINKGKMELCLLLPARLYALALWNSAGPFCDKQKAATSSALGTDGHASTGTFQLSDRLLLPNRPPTSLRAGLPTPTAAWGCGTGTCFPRIPPTSASHPCVHSVHSPAPRPRPLSMSEDTPHYPSSCQGPQGLSRVNLQNDFPQPQTS